MILLFRKELSIIQFKNQNKKISVFKSLSSKYLIISSKLLYFMNNSFREEDLLSNQDIQALDINNTEKIISEQTLKQPRRRKEAAKVEFPAKAALPNSDMDYTEAAKLLRDFQEALVVSKSPKDWDLTQLPLEQVKSLLRNSKYNYGYDPIKGRSEKPIFKCNLDLVEQSHIYNNEEAETQRFWESSKEKREKRKSAILTF